MKIKINELDENTKYVVLLKDGFIGDIEINKINQYEGTIEYKKVNSDNTSIIFYDEILELYESEEIGSLFDLFLYSKFTIFCHTEEESKELLTELVKRGYWWDRFLDEKIDPEKDCTEKAFYYIVNQDVIVYEPIEINDHINNISFDIVRLLLNRE